DIKLNDPYTPDAALRAHLNSVQIDLVALKAQLANTRNLPRALASLQAALISGRVLLEGATYQAMLKDIGWSTASLCNDRKAAARLDGVSLRLADTPQLPALSQGNAQISYANGRVTLTQGSASLGKSFLRNIESSAYFALGHRRISYSLTAAGTLDLSELYPAALALSPELAATPRGHSAAMPGSGAVAGGSPHAHTTLAPAPPPAHTAPTAD